jgi:sugar-specific transcriptional regulator TrmB/DNA-binding CsgD family transcriptional regulator
VALEILGLNGLPESVYRALLADPHSDLTLLARKLGVPDTEVRAALRRLVELSLVRERSDGRAYVPVSPEVALDAMLSVEQAELSRRERQLLQARAELARLVRTTDTPATSVRQIRRIEDPDQVVAALNDLAARCYQETLNILTDVLPADQLAASLEDDIELTRRGVRVRLLYTREQAGVQHMRDYMKQMHGHGAQVRVADTLPHRLVVFDRAIAFLPVTPGRAGAGALVVREPAIIANLVTLFGSLWSGATDLDELTESGGPGASEFDRNVLLLMSSGVKDEAAARQLNVSDRTYRRHVADILVRLGASSRFQAGVEAVRRGWL